MTISSTTNRVVYTGNAVTTAFSFPYAFFAQADLIVVSTIIATGAQTTQALTTNYTISGSTDSLGHYSSGGTVTALVAPAATVTWTIYRDPTATQTTDLVANDALPAEALEAAFDYQTMLNQRTRDIASRAIQQPEGDSATIGRLPAKVDRAGKHLTFDVNGDPGVSALTQTGTGLVYVMQTSPTLITPLLGTPTSGVLTNCTGTAAGLTAGTVTTNANLTGPITSVGNTTAVNAQTGTGSTFVMSTSPSLTTPLLGIPTSGTLTNCTGTAAGLTAGNVTTNANLTGHVTSVGNAAVLGSFTSAQLATALTDETGSGVAVFATSPSLTSPALGTPSTLVGTNISGTAASLTAGTVTTNANLTGDVTSVGNATTLTNAPVIAKVLTGYTSGAGTVAATDSILQAIQKLNGNDSTNANLTGPITSVGNATAVAAQTGTGSTFVMQASPSLTTPALGTPSAGVLTSCTGTASGLTAGNVTTNANLTGGVTSVGNAATVVTNANLTGGVTSVGNAATVVTNANLTGHVTSVGNAAVLGSFSSSQLATALTDETGSGLAVFATSPNLTTPVLGTPTSGTLTNCTGLPVVGGGTGSATAAAAKIALEVVSSATGSEIIPAGTTAQRDAAPATGYLRFNTSNVAFEGYTGAAWSSIGGGGAALSNDTATATDIYPLFAAATSGTPTTIYTSNAKLLYKPSTGEFKANAPVALNGLVMNATAVATSYTIETGYNAHSVGPVTIGGGVVITISSGQRWLVS